MMKCMNASINVMDKVTETPDENNLLTFKTTIFTNHIKLNTG